MTTVKLNERMVYSMADTLTFPVALPREFVAWLGAPAQAAETAREYILLGLYLEGRISGGKAAELLGLTRRGFVSFLARKGIDYFRLTPDEWAEEVSLVNEWSASRG
jgi:predicted HTH domain antitoxin